MIDPIDFHSVAYPAFVAPISRINVTGVGDTEILLLGVYHHQQNLSYGGGYCGLQSFSY
jgi:hypothetical protein